MHRFKLTQVWSWLKCLHGAEHVGLSQLIQAAKAGQEDERTEEILQNHDKTSHQNFRYAEGLAFSKFGRDTMRLYLISHLAKLGKRPKISK